MTPAPLMLLCDARVVAPDRVLEPGWILVKGDRIDGVGGGPPPHVPPGVVRHAGAGRTVMPGFIDLHVHGGGGGSYAGRDAREIRNALEFHRSGGTTRTLASLAAAPVADLLVALRSLAELTEDGLIAGVHLEGPFLAQRRCGAQDPRHLLEPDAMVLERLIRAGRGSVRMMTIAPELPGATDLVRRLVDGGVIAAIGHSNATYAAACSAIDAGARVATHLGNAMRPIQQREPGIVIAALEREEVVCELIADGHHLHPAMLRLAFGRADGRVALVTDATSAAGLPAGRYRFGTAWVSVKDRRAYLEGTKTLAGSTITTGDGVRHAVLVTGVALGAVARAASTVPARLLGLADEVGSIEAGKIADLVILDSELRVESVVLRGRWRAVDAPRPEGVLRAVPLSGASASAHPDEELEDGQVPPRGK